MSPNSATLTDIVADYVDANHSVRPDTLDAIPSNVRLAVVELQKKNIFPETTISFESLDLKSERRDSSDKLIYGFYDLPDDFRQLYNKGPAFEVEGSDRIYVYRDYTKFIRTFKAASKPIFTIKRFNGSHGQRNRLIAIPFPDDEDTVHITYYSNGVDMPMEHITEEYYKPVIDHVLAQLNLGAPEQVTDGVNELKRNRQNPAGQGGAHSSFAQTTPRFFGNHRN